MSWATERLMTTNDGNSLWQRLFLSLLIVCVAQTSYWVVEQIGGAQERRDMDISLHDNMSSLGAAKDSGGTDLILASESLINELRADRDWGDANTEDLLEKINDEYTSRRSRVLWEGAFFVLVLFGTMGVISKALRESRLLVKRQQNFIASVTHELRTPLTSLKLSADTLGMRAPNQETATRLAIRMSEDVERLDQMVSQILDSARIDARGETSAPEPVDLGNLLQNEVHRLHCRLAPTGILLTLHCPDEIHVFARPGDLKTVVSNLLSNAVKSCAAAGGGKTVIHVTRQSQDAVITFKDTGRGFDPEEAKLLFQRFYRPGDELRRETAGSGLGLHLVYELTKSHGGSVGASSPGQGLGATFTLTWPTTKAPAIS
jgi:signal transduction histidine kinase